MMCLLAFIVFAAIRFWGEQILFVGGQVAMDPDCCCPEVYCENCTDETPAPQLKATIGGMPEGCCFANGDYVLDWQVVCEWMYYDLPCNPGCNLVGQINFVDGHYHLDIYMGGNCWGGTWWQADLGVDKPDCSAFDLDLPLLSFTPLPNTYCDWTNATCHVTSL